ncbi:MAG: hypothetical protein KF689_01260 [Gemmatimonadaceae bacterium]|nr:hypothetical protein [Gemmatimonadaceae bacterium]MCW5826559.1 hypothetical protein [Gemmatimonadaceae bacterium]
MAEKKPFLLRVDRTLLEQYQRWAGDELRSVNGQIEFVLRDALRRAGRADGGRMTEDGSQQPTDGEDRDDA